MTPSALELLLTERIGETWLRLFESLYASGLGEHTLDQDNYCHPTDQGFPKPL
jgi:hypothetical protein